MVLPKDKVMSLQEATDYMRNFYDKELTFLWTCRAKEQLSTLDLLSGDIFHLLQYGVVKELPLQSTQKGCLKYKVECPTPNSQRHTVEAIFIPGNKLQLKLITITIKK